MSNFPMRAELKKAEKMGRRGDDRLAHINSYEAAVLRGLGGAGTINPKTGLEEYGPVQGGHGGGQGAPDPKDKPSGGNGGPKSMKDYRDLQYGETAPTTPGFGPTPRDMGPSPFDQKMDQRRKDAEQERIKSGPGGRGGAKGPGNATTADRLMADKYGVSPDRYNKEVTDYRDRLTDAYGTDDTGMDALGNLLAGFLGFNEQDPEEVGFDPQNPVGPDVDWGWDPVGPLAGVLGAGFGMPLTGVLADQISDYYGRPLEVNLGPSVFGNDDEVTGQPIGSTQTGSGLTVRDPGDNDTYLGVSPELNRLAQNLGPIMPTSSTYLGADPAVPEPAPDSGFTPTAPQPSQPDTAPGGVTVDPGNTGMTSQELTDLFLGFLKPGKTLKGKSPVSVVV